MLPNTFEGVTLKGKVGFVAYNVGYLWEIKPRTRTSSFRCPGRPEAMVQRGFGLDVADPHALEAPKRLPGERLRPERLQYRLRESPIHAPAHRGVELELGLQYTDQRSVGNAQIGDFSTWNVGSAPACPGGGSPSARPRTSRATTPISSRPTGLGPATYP